MKVLFISAESQRLYSVWFHYARVVGNPQTACYIDLVTAEAPFKTNISIGIALCHDNDTFYRALGRKIAFKRALDCFRREERGAFWAAYIAQINLPRKPR